MAQALDLALPPPHSPTPTPLPILFLLFSGRKRGTGAWSPGCPSDEFELIFASHQRPTICPPRSRLEWAKPQLAGGPRDISRAHCWPPSMGSKGLRQESQWGSLCGKTGVFSRPDTGLQPWVGGGGGSSGYHDSVPHNIIQTVSLGGLPRAICEHVPPNLQHGGGTCIPTLPLSIPQAYEPQNIRDIIDHPLRHPLPSCSLLFCQEAAACGLRQPGPELPSDQARPVAGPLPQHGSWSLG